MNEDRLIAICYISKDKINEKIYFLLKSLFIQLVLQIINNELKRIHKTRPVTHAYGTAERVSSS